MDERKQQYEEAFAAELARLNPAQQRAVQQIEGPVMVLAGPGTGKTQILAARIGCILRDTDAQAGNILCLTFTEAGVQAMRRRLIQLIGPEGHRVHIYTFHAFCHHVIQDNLAYFGGRNLEPLRDLERVEIIRRILDGLDAGHPLRRGQGNPYFYEAHLADLLQRMKAEHWLAEQVHARIEAYLDELPQRPEFTYRVNRAPHRVGDPRVALIEREHERMARLHAAVELLPVYEAALRQWGRYDYEDMVLWVVEALREQEPLLRTYQEQYLYVLVDEYQDTNGAQHELIKLLTDYWESPNLFIVGDDDQSIYEFQGARLRNLVEFYARFASSLELVVLTDNYRSRQSILDAATALINYNQQRIGRQLEGLGIEKRLWARGSGDSGLGLPVVTEFPTRLHEEAELVRLIKERHEQGVPWQEIAVIYAQHKQVVGLQRLLEREGIPYQAKRRVNALDSPLLRQLRDILQYLRLEREQPYRGEHLLFRLLHFRCFGLPPSDLAALALARLELPPAERLPWRAWLTLPAHWPNSLQAPAELARVANWLEEMLGQVDELAMPALLERVINRSGLLRWAIQSSDRDWQVQLLTTLLDFVRGEADRWPRFNLEQCLDTLERMDENQLPLAVQPAFEPELGVVLVTAHSAKGLEFDTVFMLDVTTAYWEPGNGGRARRFPLPDTLTFSGESDPLEARRRLFFVAMTRAKNHLHLTYARANEQGKALQRCVFVEELLEATDLEIALAELPAGVLERAQLLNLQETEPPQLPVPDAAAVGRLLAGISLSVSAFNRYLRCPLSFFYEVVLQAPVVQSSAATYGIAMHHSLEWCFETMQAHPERRFPSDEEVVNRFVHEMARLRAYFSEHEYQRRLEEGRRHLNHYCRTHRHNWPRRVRTEQRIRQVEVDGIPLTGVIDRIDMSEQGHQATLVDYKTGSQAEQKLARPTPANPHGGAYWRQLVFYKLLAEARTGNDLTVLEGRISYLEPNSRGQFVEKTLVYTPEDSHQLRALLADTYRRIQAQDFSTGCGQPNCIWCQFVRHQAEVDSFSDEELEALDDD